MTRTEGHRRRRRGFFLVQAVVQVVILAIVGAGMLWLGLGRHILLSRANESETGQQLASGAQSLVLACLDATDFGSSDCGLPAAAVACFPASVAGRGVTVAAAGTAPDCRVTIRINE